MARFAGDGSHHVPGHEQTETCRRGLYLKLFRESVTASRARYSPGLHADLILDDDDDNNNASAVYYYNTYAILHMESSAAPRRDITCRRQTTTASFSAQRTDRPAAQRIFQMKKQTYSSIHNVRDCVSCCPTRTVLVHVLSIESMYKLYT